MHIYLGKLVALLVLPLSWVLLAGVAAKRRRLKQERAAATLR